MSLALFPALSTMPSRRRGRPSTSASPAERERHITAALLRHVHRATLDEAAAALDVSPRTITSWVRLALTYDDPRVRFVRARLGLTP